MKQIYEMRGAGHSTRAIARELGLARNTVLRYLKSPEAIRPKPRSRRGSKLDPYTEHIDRRLGDGLENCVVLLRELRDCCGSCATWGTTAATRSCRNT